MLFPGAVLPLHIFEERYRLLVKEGSDFGVVLIRSGLEVEVAGATEPELHAVGTRASLERVEALADGRYNVLARGVQRFRMAGVERSRPYLTGEVEALPDPRERAHPRLLGLLDEYLHLHGVRIAPQVGQEVGQDVGRRAVWLVGSVLQAEAPKRQELLESGDPALAERLLVQELERLRRFRGTAPLPPRPPFPN